jgi:16S rRNA (adenine1518-N6/adenine1519-N6)-dimethyltransferase
LKNAFIAPRKRLQKNLISIFDKELVFNAFKELDIESKLRPHELSVSSHFRLFNKLN